MLWCVSLPAAHSADTDGLSVATAEPPTASARGKSVEPVSGDVEPVPKSVIPLGQSFERLYVFPANVKSELEINSAENTLVTTGPTLIN